MRSLKQRGGFTKSQIAATKGTRSRGNGENLPWVKSYKNQGRVTNLKPGAVRNTNGSLIHSRARIGMNNQFGMTHQNNNGTFGKLAQLKNVVAKSGFNYYPILHHGKTALRQFYNKALKSGIDGPKLNKSDIREQLATQSKINVLLQYCNRNVGNSKNPDLLYCRPQTKGQFNSNRSTSHTSAEKRVNAKYGFLEHETQDKQDCPALTVAKGLQELDRNDGTCKKLRDCPSVKNWKPPGWVNGVPHGCYIHSIDQRNSMTAKKTRPRDMKRGSLKTNKRFNIFRQ